MARYFIQLDHSPEECQQIMQGLLEQGPLTLLQYDFACAASDRANHVAVSIMEAASEAEARDTLLPALRDRADVLAVSKVSPEEVRSLGGL